MNMLRHENRNYEYELSDMYGKTGNWEAYDLLKDRINDKIIENYSFLK